MKKYIIFIVAGLIIMIPQPGIAGFPDKVFAPYVDVLNYPTFSIKDMYQKTDQQYFTLAFIISNGNCEPTWGGVINLADKWYMEQINYIRSEGGDVIISFGGANGTELALACHDVDSLTAAYQSVIDMYNLTWVDFDIEGMAVADKPSIDLRSKAIKNLQNNNPELKIAYCLPVLPQGLTADGLYVMQSAKNNGVRVDVLNVMSMDYGDSAAPSPDGKMGQYAIDSAENAWNQVSAIGMNVKIGVTPMIGQNDVPSERFYISDAEKLYTWANTGIWKDRVSLLSMWSCNRDNGDCPGGSAAPKCSGISQDEFEFSETFWAYSFGGGNNLLPKVSITSPSDRDTFAGLSNIIIEADATDKDGSITQIEFLSGSTSLGVDSASPYTMTYTDVPTGTYTIYAVATDDKGDTKRSSPVTLFVGDVCSDYPWESSREYNTGERVSYNNHAWKAKWWTQGNTPDGNEWEDLGECSNNTSPSVVIKLPSNGNSFSTGSDIVIEATATDIDGTITKVDFYNNGSVLLGTDATSPFGITMSNVTTGTYQLTAVATDNEGAVVTSSGVQITVNDNNEDNAKPVFESMGTRSGVVGTLLEFTLTASDPDGDALLFSSRNLPDGAGLNASGGLVQWTPAAGDTGDYTVTFIATDSHATAPLSAAQDMTITIKEKSSGGDGDKGSGDGEAGCFIGIMK